MTKECPHCETLNWNLEGNCSKCGKPIKEENGK